MHPKYLVLPGLALARHVLNCPPHQKIQKHPLDHRAHAGYELPNQLRVLLVSDPRATTPPTSPASPTSPSI